MTQSTSTPWSTFDLGDDHPWVCPDCFRVYRESTYEEQAIFRIGLSDRGVAYLNGATVSHGEPPPGTVCRHCWRPAR